MENFNQIFTLLAGHESFGLNTDILETGLINIVALLVILIYTGRDFLGSLLEERKITIVKGVQNAEDRLNEAKRRLSEAKKQLNQANLVIDEIRKETKVTKKALLESDAYQAKKDQKIRFERALAAFRSKERQIFLEIKQQMISLVLKQTVTRAKETFKSKERSTALINETINKLKGGFIMNTNPLMSKIAAPYARALFDFSVEKNIMHQITADFQNLDIFFNETVELTEYLNNPVINQQAKREVLTKILKSQINTETFKFLMVLVDRDRINVLEAIIKNYLKLIYQTASVKTIEVATASRFTNLQKDRIIQKLKELTNAREIQLILITDPSLIGGFLVKTESKVIDFTIKNQLQQLAKHLDTILEV